MRTAKLALLASAAIALAATPAVAESPSTGPALEKSFDALISAADQLQWLKEMSSAPNHVGSPHDKANAEMTLALFKQWGWDARIENFDVLYPTPISTTLELVAPEHVPLGGQEPPVAEDPTSNLAGMLPPYVAYQGDGDVTAPVVYVNYGMPDDYEALAERGIDVKGKIVLVYALLKAAQLSLKGAPDEARAILAGAFLRPPPSDVEAKIKDGEARRLAFGERA